MIRLGLMGGTFNPPHNGHLHAAACAREDLRLDKVLFIPTNLPPHKQLPEGSAKTSHGRSCLPSKSSGAAQATRWTPCGSSPRLTVSCS